MELVVGTSHRDLYTDVSRHLRNSNSLQLGFQFVARLSCLCLALIR